MNHLLIGDTTGGEKLKKTTGFPPLRYPATFQSRPGSFIQQIFISASSDPAKSPRWGSRDREKLWNKVLSRPGARVA